MLRPIIALLIALLAAPALAQPEEISLAANATHAHEDSGMTFPPAIGEFARERMVRFDGENDVSAVYELPDKKVWVSIYLTRVGTPDASLWFDRVTGVVVMRDGFRPPAGADLAGTPFTAPGFTRPSGLMLTYDVEDDGGVSATGVALAAYGTYLLKVRMSTSSLSGAELAETLSAFLAGMPSPKARGNEPEPYVVATCPDALKFDRKAKQKKVEMQDAMVLALLAGGMGAAVDQGGDPAVGLPRPVYCRDPSSTPALMVYRPEASTSGYLLSYNDTGSAVVVGGGGSSLFDQITGELGGSKGPSFGVIHQEPAGNTVYPPFDRLPSPEAVLKVPGSQAPVARSDRGNNIEIFAQ